MATPNIEPYNKYVGNDAATEFAIGFSYIDRSFVKVYLKRSDEVQQLLTTDDYEFVNDKTIRFPKTGSAEPVLATGDVLVVQRETTVDSDYEFSNQKRLFPEDVMNIDDKEMQILQEQARELKRAVKVSPTSEVNPDQLIYEVERIYLSIDNIDTVSGHIGNVDIVAVDIDNVDIVASISADISACVEISEYITTVAANIAEVISVSEDIEDVVKVGQNIENVKAVADNETNINAVNANKANIDAAVANMAAILDAPNQATAAANSASAAAGSASAASTSETNAAASASAAASSATNAANSASTATTKATEASNSASAAAGSASTATTQANAAANSASSASTSASTATTQAGLAQGYATAAGASATAAATSETNAGNSATAASGSASSASSSASAAASSAQLAGYAATGTLEQYPEGSAKYWAQESARGQLQADFEQTDQTAKDFVKNKRTSLLENDSDYQTGTQVVNTIKSMRKEGIPMSIIEHRRIVKNGSTVQLYWKDPDDTIIDGFVMSSWKSTTIVKKEGSYPENEEDGIVVGTYTTRNQHYETPLTDTQEDSENWFYRAFPKSVNGVYSYDQRNCFGLVVFGYRINEVDSVPSTRVEYLKWTDNAFYDPCVMDFVSDEFNWGDWEDAFFIPKPCLLKTNGTVDFYLSKKDFRYKDDGVTPSNVETLPSNGNFMMEYPQIFIKTYKEGNYNYVIFANQKADDSFECWPCKKSDGTYAEHFYLPMFEGTVVSNVMRSYASNGKPTGNTTSENEATYATANGTGWNTTTWADEVIAMLLFPLLFKSTDSQGKLGFGGSSSTSGLTVNNNAAISKGMMYGTASGSSFGVTYLGMHNWWGHRWRRPNGLMNASGEYKFKMTYSTIDGSTVTGYNRTGNGYISSGITPPTASESYINRYLPVGKFGMVPKATTGSSTTFYCDGMWTNNGKLDQLILGGSVYHGALDGVFCFCVDVAPSNSAWTDGASLSYHTF